MTTQRLIFHIGHPKTGTTTLQKTLKASRPSLIDCGILHPNIGHHANHKSLLPHLTNVEAGTQQQKDSSSKKIRTSKEKWNQMLEEVNTHNPHTIILSSESFSRVLKDDAFRNQEAHLKSLASEIVIAAYLREPASLALSRAQQNIKYSPNFELRPKDYYRSVLEPFKNSGLGSMNVRIFDRSALEGGDIVKDFFTQNVPGFAPEQLTRLKDDNTTFSAEAMALIQEVHRKERPFPWRKAWRSIETADRKLDGFCRPRMHDHIRQAIQSRCTDLDWLKAQFNLKFPKIEPGAMSQSEADRWCDALDRVEDMCAVDAGRKEALWNAVCEDQKPIRRLLHKFRNRS